jgi:hypothetical protein
MGKPNDRAGTAEAFAQPIIAIFVGRDRKDLVRVLAHHAIALARNSFESCAVRFRIIDASDVLDDVLTGTIPNIDAEREVVFVFTA